MNILNSVLCFLLSINIGLFSPRYALAQQDSVLRLTQSEAEGIFLKNNLSLLAQKYNISIQEAFVKQARLWPNPELTAQYAMYSDDAEYLFDMKGLYSEHVFQIEQLIQTAGKRGKLIKLAKSNQRIEELNFEEVLRNLKFELRQAFYQLHVLNETETLLIEQLEEAKKLQLGNEALYRAGNISQKELLRIQSLVILLEQEKNDNKAQIIEQQTLLNTLMNLESRTAIVPLIDHLSPPVLTYQTDSLFEIAKTYRPDYKMTLELQQQQHSNLQYQKALAIPDVGILINYDRYAGPSPNFFQVGVDLPLPFFNRNQGNIKAAKQQIKQQETLVMNQENILKNEVAEGYAKWKNIKILHDLGYDKLQNDYERMKTSVIENYSKRQISQLEFLDFFDTYRSTRLAVLQQELNLKIAAETLNYVIGFEIIH